MPELPEVETTRLGIEPHLVGYKIKCIRIHNASLRWPIPDTINQLNDANVISVGRRGKYLLVNVAAGTAIIHLGMSGSLRLSQPNEVLRKHDHVEIVIETGQILRYHDPRRFGCVLWQGADEPTHSLLAKLGPEPLSDAFDSDHLFKATRNRQVAIKNLIMNSEVVVGVGNIYASESLFMAGIRPGRAAKRVTKNESSRLVDTIKQVLQRSITQGGTTLRDFVNSDGNPGYFAQQLQVYGRTDEPCRVCETPISQKTIGQRSTFYCKLCQR